MQTSTPSELPMVEQTIQEFDALAERLRKNNQDFIVEPRTRFKGEAGEQRTMFICDPSNNAIEFKAFANLDTLFKPL